MGMAWQLANNFSQLIVYLWVPRGAERDRGYLTWTEKLLSTGYQCVWRQISSVVLINWLLNEPLQNHKIRKSKTSEEDENADHHSFRWMTWMRNSIGNYTTISSVVWTSKCVSLEPSNGKTDMLMYIFSKKQQLISE